MDSLQRRERCGRETGGVGGCRYCGEWQPEEGVVESVERRASLLSWRYSSCRARISHGDCSVELGREDNGCGLERGIPSERRLTGE